MVDFANSGGHKRGVVSAPHMAAAKDGQRILAQGGNAIEAMIAMAASIAAVYPHMNHIGGDAIACRIVIRILLDDTLLSSARRTA